MVTRIRGQITIDRPVELVFDCVADGTNEPAYNPQMVRAEKLTSGPVGPGTRFRAVFAGRRRMVPMDVETLEYERPARLRSRTTMEAAEIEGTLTFAPLPTGSTRMAWSWEVRPRGAMRLATPVIGWLGRRQEQRIWAGLKDYLEHAGPRGPADAGA